MTGYLESYGAGEERRERIIKWILLVSAITLVVGATSYFLFRNYREVRQAKLFFELLRNSEYEAAYALWGCTDDSPCPDYPMEKFLEDWGPGSPHADLSEMHFARTRGCRTGVIVEVDFGDPRHEYLWVERGSRRIGYAPWPVCSPRLPPVVSTE
jgi:hypothetical protein